MDDLAHSAAPNTQRGAGENSDNIHKLDHLTIEDRLAMFTEYNLATLEILQDVKSSSRSSIRRQQSICDQMVKACIDFGAPGPHRFGGPRCGRLVTAIASVSMGMSEANEQKSSTHKEAGEDE